MRQLTFRMNALSGGQNVADVIGASFNVIMTALQAMPDKRLLSATAVSLRDMASQLDTMASDERQ